MSESDHDILIRLDEKQDALIQQFTNHLKHHAMYTLLAASTSLGLIVSLILIIVKLV